MNLAIIMPLILLHRSRKNRPARLLRSTAVCPSTATSICYVSKDSVSLDNLIYSSASQKYRPADDAATGWLRYLALSGQKDENAGGSRAATNQKPANHQAVVEVRKGDSNCHSQGPQLSLDRLQNTIVLNIRKVTSILPLELDSQKFRTTQEERASMLSVWELMDLLLY
ncbi:uncharacterized protein BT62DRAFT_932051 [Guyanagaster necrorhizus]|uniref:Uncharacterized protein n=1 Tax=Guyanagaster necrorhizus TaxID=856835 RepID=A0A9P8ASR6_9AGAR|nr:uncharacterized protein BT62DRAFT_932051 [Guyanagaster necrorhizus MCA 3950]KAG7446614.1 hypothetical protein BT62DRAFT_932051 [Guyanagaster necrorhizus MCA 3950]